MNVYYPLKTEKVWHFGEKGNKYRLDAIKRMILLKDLLKNDDNFKIVNVDRKDGSVLGLAHTPRLLTAYREGDPRELANSSGVLWQKGFYAWIINQAWANILSAQQALHSGKSLALADGGHHAQKEKGFGFNPINNLVITARYLLQRNLVKRVAILDLDVHFANGTHSLLLKDEPILSTDIWKLKLAKWTYTNNRNNVFHQRAQDPPEYFRVLPLLLKKIKDYKPDIILYYLGLDVWEKDRFNGIKGFGEKSILRRERMVSNFFHQEKIPYSISIGGGYVNYQQTKGEIQEQWRSLIGLFKQCLEIYIK